VRIKKINQVRKARRGDLPHPKIYSITENRIRTRCTKLQPQTASEEVRRRWCLPCFTQTWKFK